MKNAPKMMTTESVKMEEWMRKTVTSSPAIAHPMPNINPPKHSLIFVWGLLDGSIGYSCDYDDSRTKFLMLLLLSERELPLDELVEEEVEDGCGCKED